MHFYLNSYEVLMLHCVMFPVAPYLPCNAAPAAHNQLTSSPTNFADLT